MDRRLLLALAAGFVAIIVSRGSPPAAPPAPARSPTSSVDPAPTPTVWTRWATPSAAEALVAAPDPSASPETKPGGIDRLLIEVKKAHQRMEEAWEKYPEFVIVKHADGTTGIYRLEDWAPNSEQIYARKFLDGGLGWYAGPDAGLPSDPAAFVPIWDLVSPDGWYTTPSGRRIQFLKSIDPSVQLRLVDTPDADPP